MFQDYPVAYLWLLDELECAVVIDADIDLVFIFFKVVMLGELLPGLTVLYAASVMVVEQPSSEVHCSTDIH